MNNADYVEEEDEEVEEGLFELGADVPDVDGVGAVGVDDAPEEDGAGDAAVAVAGSLFFFSSPALSFAFSGPSDPAVGLSLSE